MSSLRGFLVPFYVLENFLSFDFTRILPPRSTKTCNITPLIKLGLRYFKFVVFSVTDDSRRVEVCAVCRSGPEPHP